MAASTTRSMRPSSNYVRESDVLTNLEILERGFEQASPATVTLAK
ncbi:Putative oxidoreductase [Cronobacter dublinensis 582]|nr:Putative oxidoreductase [Cronobacter dublinensis 582]